jgi:hypothetical protein
MWLLYGGGSQIVCRKKPATGLEMHGSHGYIGETVEEELNSCCCMLEGISDTCGMCNGLVQWSVT